MKALASQNRLMILCQLADGEKSVGQLTALLGLRQTAMSQQLALLRRDGLVTTRRDARHVFYALDGIEVRKAIEVLYTLYCGPDGQHSLDERSGRHLEKEHAHAERR